MNNTKWIRNVCVNVYPVTRSCCGGSDGDDSGENFTCFCCFYLPVCVCLFSDCERNNFFCCFCGRSSWLRFGSNTLHYEARRRTRGRNIETRELAAFANGLALLFTNTHLNEMPFEYNEYLYKFNQAVDRLFLSSGTRCKHSPLFDHQQTRKKGSMPNADCDTHMIFCVFGQEDERDERKKLLRWMNSKWSGRSRHNGQWARGNRSPASNTSGPNRLHLHMKN